MLTISEAFRIKKSHFTIKLKNKIEFINTFITIDLLRYANSNYVHVSLMFKKSAIKTLREI